MRFLVRHWYAAKMGRAYLKTLDRGDAMNYRDKTDEELLAIAGESDALFGDLLIRILRRLTEVREHVEAIENRLGSLTPPPSA